MNYLAHLLLADDTDASRIGNLLGDFTRGPIQQLEKQFPPEIIRGIRMHRAIDRFTDDHPLFGKAKQLLAPQRRRFAGVAVDIFYDHFLCNDWTTYSDIPLDEFTTSVYQALANHPEWLVGNLKIAFPHMQKQNWLASYATIEGIETTLRRVSTRSPRVSALAHCITDLKNNYPAFEQIFKDFMPELLKFVANWKKEN